MTMRECLTKIAQEATRWNVVFLRHQTPDPAAENTHLSSQTTPSNAIVCGSVIGPVILVSAATFMPRHFVATPLTT
jgi:hypothetical protein